MNKPSLQNENSRRLINTVAYYVAFITLGLTVGATGPVLSTLAQNTGSTLDGVSIIFVAASIGYMAGTWIGGRVYDRFSGHRIIASALIIASVMLFLIPGVSSLWLLASVIAVLSFFQGFVDVGGNTLLIWLHGSKVGPFMNGLHFFFGLGAFVAPIVVAQVIGSSGDIRGVYWLFAIVNLPIAVWFWLLPSPAVRLQTMTVNETKIPTAPLILILLIAFFFLYVGMESGYGNWIYTYAFKLKLADAAGAAYLTSAFWGAFTLFRMVAIWISTKTSPQKILLADFAGAAVGLGLILMMPGSQVGLWIGTIVLGASIASIFPTMLTLAEQRLHVTGSMLSWCFAGGGVGHMILPWLIGQIIVPLGATSMMAFIMIDLIFNVSILTLVLRKSKNA